ncbi:MAG TPA: hypothetical protein VN736_01900 [Candidatus Limnocylindrales bacterium]|nr:hypothetical protein [Candidatus Limnocylindrales bacterium]
MDRRDFFRTTPTAFAALSVFSETAGAQDILKADPAAVDFWTKQMGVSPDLLPPAGPKRLAAPGERSGLTPEMQQAEMEPFFFYFDDQSDDPAAPVIAAQDLRTTELDAHEDGGRDVRITFVKRRLRFGENDRATYENYQSSGLYLETQQHPEAPSDH